MRERLVVAAVVGMMLSTGAVRAAETGDAATKPAGADYSDPRKAVAAFLVAVQSGDGDAIKRAIFIGPSEQKITDTLVGLWVAQGKLRSAAEEKFGEGAAPYFGAVSSQIQSRLKALETAPVKMMEDSAILTIPSDEAFRQSSGTVVLKKIGAAWKLDATTLFNLSAVSSDKTDQRVALASKLIGITDGMTGDIMAGKFPSAGQAYQEFWNRSLAVSKQAQAGPSTQAK